MVDLIEEDENKDKYLESLGFTVLRFENRFMCRDPEYLVSGISKVLTKSHESNR